MPDDTGFTVPTFVIAGMLAPTLRELDAGIDLTGWMERERNKTPEQREADRVAVEKRRAEQYAANLARWEATASKWRGGVREVLEMHTPSDWGSCDGHDDESWPCPEFEALERDLGNLA